MRGHRFSRQGIVYFFVDLLGCNSVFGIVSNLLFPSSNGFINRMLHAALFTAVSFAHGHLLAVYHLLCSEYHTITVFG